MEKSIFLFDFSCIKVDNKYMILNACSEDFIFLIQMIMTAIKYVLYLKQSNTFFT